MGIKERRLREKEEVRSTILTAGWRLVKEEGWESLSIRKIADAIEYSIPVIYDHFENKEAILEEYGKEGFRALTKKLKKAKEKHQQPGDQLKSIAEAYWDFAMKNTEHYQLMYGVGMACCGSSDCIDEQSAFRELIAEPISELIAKGKHPHANPCLKYHTYWSIMHGLISIRMTNRSDVSDQLNKLVLSDAVEGFIKNLD
jgi:AcrR family transcriptional regulator